MKQFVAIEGTAEPNVFLVHSFVAVKSESQMTKIRGLGRFRRPPAEIPSDLPPEIEEQAYDEPDYYMMDDKIVIVRNGEELIKAVNDAYEAHQQLRELSRTHRLQGAVGPGAVPGYDHGGAYGTAMMV